MTYYLIFSIVFLVVIFTTNMIWISKVIKPIAQEDPKGKEMVYGSATSWYFKPELIYKMLKKLIKKTEGEEKVQYKTVLRRFIILQVLYGLGFLNFMVYHFAT